VAQAIAAGSARAQSTAFLWVRLDEQTAAASVPRAALAEQVVELLRRNLRHGDVLSIGTDAIQVLLPATARDQALHVASRLGTAVRQHGFLGIAGDLPRPVATISLGLALAPSHGTKLDHLAEAARGAGEHVASTGGDSAAVAAMRAGDPPERQFEIDRFVGRVEELSTLRRALDDAIGGSPRVVGVLGEAGLGRGTLLRQIESEVRLRGGSLVVARARSASIRQPYGIWSQLLEALQRLPDAPNRAWPHLSHLDSRMPAGEAPRTGSKFQLLEELSEYVRLCARSRPLVVILEEMQWAEAASWDALDHLLTQLERERLLVAFTMREDPGHPEHERRKTFERFSNYEEIRLSRLTRDEVKRWIESAVQRQEVGREALAFIYRHAEGNPLYISQLLHWMLEEGAVRHTGARWEWSPVSELRLPSGLDEIIRRRVARLEPATQEIIQTAAVIGRQFELEVLVAAAGVPATSVQAAIREAAGRRILNPWYERGGGGQAFMHERICDAVVAVLPADKVSRAHERIARALQDRPNADVDAAAHFDAAGCAAEAHAYALRAAERAEGLHVYQAASDLLQIAARNAPAPGDLAEVRIRMAGIAEALGRFDETEELCDLAIEWFSSRGDRARALTLRRMRERARRELGQPAKVTLDALRELDEEAKAVGSDQERIEILTMESQTYARLGEPQMAEQLAAECVAMADHVGDDALRAAAFNRLGITVRAQDPRRAREHFKQALQLYEKIGDVRGQARCHNNLGITQAETHADLGRDSLTMAITLARAAGMPDLAATAALNLGVIMQKMGDHARARELYGDAMALFATVKNSELQLYALYNIANVERDAENFESGAELYDATSSLAKRIGQSEVEIGAIAGEGLCLLAIGKMDAVRVHSAEIEQRMSGTKDWFQGRELVEAFRVRSAVAEGRRAEAMQIFETARERAANLEIYSVMWLTAAVADLLLPLHPDRIRPLLEEYAAESANLGFTDLVRKFALILDTRSTAAAAAPVQG
jgi:tetratricopeptide (TPR) repeat protein